jgi:hypothetical protein
LKCASVRAIGRFAFGPGRTDGAVAYIQVACSIYQGYTSRFPGYISKATMLLVSESGASRKTQDKRGKIFFGTFDLGVKGIMLTIHKPRNSSFLDASSFEKVLNALFHRVTPVRSTLKSVDGLCGVDTRKDQILTLHTGRLCFSQKPAELHNLVQECFVERRKASCAGPCTV